VKPRLVILGCGGHGKVVADAAAATWDVLGFADENPDRMGTTITGDLSVVVVGVDALAGYCREHDAAVVIAVGHNLARKHLFERLSATGLTLATVIHPSAVISATATIGAGTVVFAGTVVNPDTTIGDNVIVNTGATIDHDSKVADHAHLSPGVATGGTVTIGQGTHLGVGVSVRNNTDIGAWSVVGVGAAVVQNLPDNVVAYGVPARVVAKYEP